MKKPMIILPLDTYASSKLLFKEVSKFFADPDVRELVAYIKLNDAVHQPDMGGPTLIIRLKNLLKKLGSKAKIFLDLKVFDVSATLVNILKKYNTEACPPDILTVSSNCSVEGIMKLRRLLPNTKLALVSALTDIPQEEFLMRFGKTPEIHILSDLVNIREIYKKKIAADKDLQSATEPFDLIVCSPLELDFLKHNLKKLNDLGSEYGFIVPGIRDEWMKKPDEHQKRTTGICTALQKGATYVVLGAQLRDGNPFQNISPGDSRRRTINEINLSNYGLIVKGDPLETLKNCEGYYESPKDETGKYIGPVVGYTDKKYVTAEGHKYMAGFVYLNFAAAEQRPEVRKYFADEIAKLTAKFKSPETVVLGVPPGGLLLAADLGRSLKARTILAEKNIGLVVNRHNIYAGDEIILIEDQITGFANAKMIKDLVEERGAKIMAIACAFNTSGTTLYGDIPVISVCDLTINQYQQDDPMVADLIAADKFIPKPRHSWPSLALAMGEKD